MSEQEYACQLLNVADAPKHPKLPFFVEGVAWVDFRKQDPDPMKQLIWGITGQRELIL